MLAHDLDAWLADVAQRQKPATVDFYRRRALWIRHTFGKRDWSDLTAPLVLQAIDQANRWPNNLQKAPDTCRGNIIAWDQFQKWALDTGRLSEPVTTKKIKKPAGRLREVLPSPEDIRRILAAASPAFAAIYQALLFTGARPGELCRATIADFDRKRRVISLKEHKTAGKTHRPRLIPISEPCLEILTAAIAGNKTGPIFRRKDGEGWTVPHLSASFRRLRKSCLVDRRVVLYSTRHNLATELCRAKGIHAAAAVLGHKGLQTIQRYVHPGAKDLVDYIDALNAPPEDPQAPPKAA